MNSSQQLERIVAYLDGELSADESAQVEQQLAADEGFRQELQGAQRAWTALDELPMAQVSDDFSHTTMEMVVSAARQDVQAQTIALPVQQRKRKAATALLVLASVLLGALAFRVLWDNPNRRLLANLPIIQNVDIYSQFHTVDFLRQLHRLMDKHWENSPNDAAQIEAKSAVYLTVSANEGREDWLALLPDDEKIFLRAKLNRFRDLTTQRQTEMHEVHQQLYSASDRQPLLETMFRYQQWLSDLTPSEQYELRDLQATERARRVAREMINAASAQKFALTTEQLEELFRKIRPHIEQLVRRIRSENEREHSKRTHRQKWEFPPPPNPEQIKRFLQQVMRKSPDQFRKLNDAIVEALPAEMGQAFQKLLPRQKVDRIRAWARQLRFQAAGMFHPIKGGRTGGISEQELADFFVELDPADKERLLALSRDKMKLQLTRMLIGKMPHRDRYARGDRPPPGPPSPGDRRRRPHFEDGHERPTRNFDRGRRPQHRRPEDAAPRE